MYKLENNENGKQLIERLDDENAKLLYSYGFECGVLDYSPIDYAKGFVVMKSVSIQLKATGSPTGKPTRERALDVSIKLSDCIVEGNISLDTLKDLYINAVLLKQSPVEPQPPQVEE